MHFLKTERDLLNLTCLTWGDLVDRISNKDQPKHSFCKDALAQPLKLKDSLRIRDGLGGHDVRPVGWLQFKISRLNLPDLGSLWISNN